MPGPPSRITPEVTFPHFSLIDCARKAHKLATQYQTGVFYPIKSISKKRTPTIVNLTVKQRYLTEREVERLMDSFQHLAQEGVKIALVLPDTMFLNERFDCECELSAGPKSRDGRS